MKKIFLIFIVSLVLTSKVKTQSKNLLTYLDGIKLTFSVGNTVQGNGGSNGILFSSEVGYKIKINQKDFFILGIGHEATRYNKTFSEISRSKVYTFSSSIFTELRIAKIKLLNTKVHPYIGFGYGIYAIGVNFEEIPYEIFSETEERNIIAVHYYNVDFVRELLFAPNFRMGLRFKHFDLSVNFNIIPKREVLVSLTRNFNTAFSSNYEIDSSYLSIRLGLPADDWFRKRKNK